MFNLKTYKVLLKLILNRDLLGCKITVLLNKFFNQNQVSYKANFHPTKNEAFFHIQTCRTRFDLHLFFYLCRQKIIALNIVVNVSFNHDV